MSEITALNNEIRFPEVFIIDIFLPKCHKSQIKQEDLINESAQSENMKKRAGKKENNYCSMGQILQKSRKERKQLLLK